MYTKKKQNTECCVIQKETQVGSINFWFFLFIHCFNMLNRNQQQKTKDNDRLIEQKIKNKKRKQTKTLNHVEFSVSSVAVDFAAFSSVVSSTFVSVSFFGISTFVEFDTVSVVCTTGEFRCCSSSYSLIIRFLSECELFDEPEGVGEETIGGVELVLIDIEFIGGLFVFEEWSIDSNCVSDGDDIWFNLRGILVLGECSRVGDGDDCCCCCGCSSETLIINW